MVFSIGYRRVLEKRFIMKYNATKDNLKEMTNVHFP